MLTSLTTVWTTRRQVSKASQTHSKPSSLHCDRCYRLSWRLKCTYLRFIFGLKGCVWFMRDLTPATGDRGQKWSTLCVFVVLSRWLVYSWIQPDSAARFPDCASEQEPQSGSGIPRPRQTQGFLRQRGRAAGGERLRLLDTTHYTDIVKNERSESWSGTGRCTCL